MDFNTWAGAYAVQELLQAAHDDHHDLVILDRGPWDAGCWLQYWASQMNAPETNDVMKFFQLDHWMTRSDLHILLLVEPAEAVKREREHRLIAHKGASSNEQLMEAMHNIYERRFVDLRRIKELSCPHVGERGAKRINTTGKQRGDIALQIIEATFDVLATKIGYHSAGFTFTEGRVMEQLAVYLPGTRTRMKRDLRECISDFVDQANALPAHQKHELAALLDDCSIPDQKTPLVSLRVPAETLRNSLNDLLAQVRSK